MLRIISFMLISLLAEGCFASIYMQKNENGSVSYSDVPKGDSQPVSLSSVSYVPSVSGESASTSSTAEKSSTANQPAAQSADTTEHKPYQSFSIIWPGDNETVQNEPSITVKTATDPALQAGDTIQVFVDGSPWGEPEANTNITLTNIDRGEHTVFAKLYDNNHQTLKQTATVRVFIHKQSLNFQPKQPH